MTINVFNFNSLTDLARQRLDQPNAIKAMAQEIRRETTVWQRVWLWLTQGFTSVEERVTQAFQVARMEAHRIEHQAARAQFPQSPNSRFPLPATAERSTESSPAPATAAAAAETPSRPRSALAAAERSAEPSPAPAAALCHVARKEIEAIFQRYHLLIKKKATETDKASWRELGVDVDEEVYHALHPNQNVPADSSFSRELDKEDQKKRRKQEKALFGDSCSFIVAYTARRLGWTHDDFTVQFNKALSIAEQPSPQPTHSQIVAVLLKEIINPLLAKLTCREDRPEYAREIRMIRQAKPVYDPLIAQDLTEPEIWRLIRAVVADQKSDADLLRRFEIAVNAINQRQYLYMPRQGRFARASELPAAVAAAIKPSDDAAAGSPQEEEEDVEPNWVKERNRKAASAPASGRTSPSPAAGAQSPITPREKSRQFWLRDRNVLNAFKNYKLYDTLRSKQLDDQAIVRLLRIVHGDQIDEGDEYIYLAPLDQVKKCTENIYKFLSLFDKTFGTDPAKISQLVAFMESPTEDDPVLAMEAYNLSIRFKENLDTYPGPKLRTFYFLLSPELRRCLEHDIVNNFLIAFSRKQFEALIREPLTYEEKTTFDQDLQADFNAPNEIDNNHRLKLLDKDDFHRYAQSHVFLLTSLFESMSQQKTSEDKKEIFFKCLEEWAQGDCYLFYILQTMATQRAILKLPHIIGKAWQKKGLNFGIFPIKTPPTSNWIAPDGRGGFYVICESRVVLERPIEKGGELANHTVHIRYHITQTDGRWHCTNPEWHYGPAPNSRLEQSGSNTHLPTGGIKGAAADAAAAAADSTVPVSN